MILAVGRTYRAKHPGYAHGFVNDRTVIWVDSMRERVQYDGPSVGLGRTRPFVPYADFVKWADRDVTDELPEGEYAQWLEWLAQKQVAKQNKRLGIGCAKA